MEAMGKRIRFFSFILGILLATGARAEIPGFLLVTKDFGPGLNENLRLTRMAISDANLSLTMIVEDRPITYLYDLKNPDQLVMLDRINQTYTVLTEKSVQEQASYMTEVFKKQEEAAKKIRERIEAETRDREAEKRDSLGNALGDQFTPDVDSLGPSVDTLDNSMHLPPALQEAQKKLAKKEQEEKIQRSKKKQKGKKAQKLSKDSRGVELFTDREVPSLRWMDSGVKVHRWSCTKYISQTGERTFEELYTTPWFVMGVEPSNFKIFDSLKKHFKPLFSFFNVSVVPGIGSREVWNEPTVKGFPVKFIRYRNNKPYRIMKVLKAEQRVFPHSMFELLESYRPSESKVENTQ